MVSMMKRWKWESGAIPEDILTLVFGGDIADLNIRAVVYVWNIAVFSL